MRKPATAAATLANANSLNSFDMAGSDGVSGIEVYKRNDQNLVLCTTFVSLVQNHGKPSCLFLNLSPLSFFP